MSLAISTPGTVFRFSVRIAGVIVAQRVLTEWTKRSRGAPAATRRNAVPEGFPVPSGTGAHLVAARERDDFVPAEVVSDGVPGVRWEVRDGRLAVTAATDVWCRCFTVFPQRAEKVVLLLEPGTWGRWRVNFRLWEDFNSSEWHYQKWVVNVAHRVPAMNGLFLGSPDVRVDDLVQLTRPTGPRREIHLPRLP
jgi:hypothetical protein